MELIKTEQTYTIKIYVPKEYLYDEDGEKKDIGFEEHAVASPPRYYYDEEVKKWCLEFAGADLNGYEVQDFAFFFDSEEDLLKFLKR